LGSASGCATACGDENCDACCGVVANVRWIGDAICFGLCVFSARWFCSETGDDHDSMSLIGGGIYCVTRVDVAWENLHHLRTVRFYDYDWTMLKGCDFSIDCDDWFQLLRDDRSETPCCRGVR
jgi:hypothetical protein